MTAIITPLTWRRAYRRPGADKHLSPSVLIADVPLELTALAYNILGLTPPDEVTVPISLVASVTRPTAPVVWATSSIAESWSFEADEHPLVPPQWHGLGYKPRTRYQLPEAGTPAYFRGVYDGELIEGVGYTDLAAGVVRIGAKVVVFDSSSYPRDAIFAWHPIPPCDWGADQ